jgi:hypothetical protein
MMRKPQPKVIASIAAPAAPHGNDYKYAGLEHGDDWSTDEICSRVIVSE